VEPQGYKNKDPNRNFVRNCKFEVSASLQLKLAPLVGGNIAFELTIYGLDGQQG
jgi:hypothetical protein